MRSSYESSLSRMAVLGLQAGTWIALTTVAVSSTSSRRYQWRHHMARRGAVAKVALPSTSVFVYQLDCIIAAHH